MRILVTGAASFIGSHVVHELRLTAQATFALLVNHLLLTAW